MAKPTQADIEQMIQYARPTNRDLARRDISQALNSTTSSLLLKIAPFYYNNGTSKDLLCLYGTVTCYYRGNRYNIPIELWLQQDHPTVPPLAYVKPTPDMYVAPTSRDVLPDGTVIIPYLKSWRHPQSDLITLLKAMSDAFSVSPPVYANPGGSSNYSTSYASNPPSYPANPTPYASNPTPYPANTTPYPTSSTSMPMPSGYGTGGGGSTSHSYPHGYPQTQIPQEVYRESIQSAVLDKIRIRLDETLQIGNVEIESLRKTEQDLIEGEKKLQTLINQAQQQQTEAQNHMVSLRTKINEMLEATQKMSSSSSSTSEKENSIKEDALITPAPVYKQLLQAYAEEHAIQDLSYYLADGLRRKSIGLDTYLKHVRELSRKQFMLRAIMQKCRQVAGLPIK